MLRNLSCKARSREKKPYTPSSPEKWATFYFSTGPSLKRQEGDLLSSRKSSANKKDAKAFLVTDSLCFQLWEWIEQVGEVSLLSLQSKQVHLVTYSVTFQL